MYSLIYEQGWRSGESSRLPPMFPGFDSRTRRHMWVEFVVGSLPCSERFFSGYSGFLLCSKKHISKFHFWNPETGIVKHFIMSPWLGWLRKHSLCLTLNLHLHCSIFLMITIYRVSISFYHLSLSYWYLHCMFLAMWSKTLALQICKWGPNVTKKEGLASCSVKVLPDKQFFNTTKNIQADLSEKETYYSIPYFERRCPFYITISVSQVVALGDQHATNSIKRFSNVITHIWYK